MLETKISADFRGLNSRVIFGIFRQIHPVFFSLCVCVCVRERERTFMQIAVGSPDYGLPSYSASQEACTISHVSLRIV